MFDGEIHIFRRPTCPPFPKCMRRVLYAVHTQTLGSNDFSCEIEVVKEHNIIRHCNSYPSADQISEYARGERREQGWCKNVVLFFRSLVSLALSYARCSFPTKHSLRSSVRSAEGFSRDAFFWSFSSSTANLLRNFHLTSFNHFCNQRKKVELSQQIFHLSKKTSRVSSLNSGNDTMIKVS